MKFTKEAMNLEKSLTKEWLITNGIGGYSSSTIIGANTRRYHGLLIAPLTPPANRCLVLSKLDESMILQGKKYNLFTNICENYISEGYKYQTAFEKEYLPKFTYQIEDVKIEKQVCMKYKQNTVCVQYQIKTGSNPITLTLAPVINFRDFHSMSHQEEYDLTQKTVNQKMKIIINEKYPIYLYISEGKYIEHQKDIFRNMYYLEEEKRGFYPKENHMVPGRYEIEIPPKQTKEISFICSLEKGIQKIDVKKVIKQEEKRLQQLIKNTHLIKEQSQKEQELLKQLIIASDNFIVERQNTKLHTIIAGYPWFLDWGRDTLISFEGLVLKTKRFDLAKEIFMTSIKDIKCGLIPNGYSEADNKPLYNSVDASLLLFEQVNKYLSYTGDEAFIKEYLYPVLINIISEYEKGIDLDNNNIYLDKDGLLVSGTENTQNTWMDAKVSGIVATPRNGKAVEINALWYNALKTLEKLSKQWGDTETNNICRKLSKKCKIEFNNKFYNKTKKCLYDVLGDAKIRPNQLFSLALTYPIIDPSSEMAKEIFNTITKKLLKKHGLKTLARGEKDYIEVYEGDSFKRDMSYHQGITWVWLLGIYNDAFQNIIKAQKNKKELQQEYDKWLEDIKKTFYAAIMEEGCIGNISELYDSRPPYLPKGTIAQAWSVAEILRIIEK